MARRNIFDRAREFIAGTSRRVQDAITTFFERSNDPIENEELTPIIDFESGSLNENQDSINEPEKPSDEQIAEELENADPPIHDFSPESIPDEPDTPDEEFESEFGFEISQFEAYDPKELRRILATFDEAVSYARDITLPSDDITIVQDSDTGLFRVRVEYEVVLSE